MVSPAVAAPTKHVGSLPATSRVRPGRRWTSPRTVARAASCASASARTRVLELDASVVNRLGYHPVRLTDAGACTSCVLCARICPGRGVHRLRATTKERP